MGIYTTVIAELTCARCHASFEGDEREYPDPPTNEYSATRRAIEKRFVDYGYYNVPASMLDATGETTCMVADAIDDLADTTNELRAVAWCYENTSEGDALWYFTHGFDWHWEAQLRGLQQCLLAQRGLT